jgi:hypothetical protein
MIKEDNAILFKCNKISGILFYIFEYMEYLENNNTNINIYIILTEDVDKKIIIDLFKAKYKKKYWYLINKIKFLNTFPIFFINKLIIFDNTTLQYVSSKIIYKKLLYNYTNSLGDDNYLEVPKLKNITLFGDTDLIKDNTIIPHKLCLNYKIFKKLSTFDNSTFIQDNKKSKDNTKNRSINFHKTFNKCIFIQNDFFDKANRLIPECKFYNKEIQVIFNPKVKDSLRYRLENYLELDIYKSNFNKIVKDFFEE